MCIYRKPHIWCDSLQLWPLIPLKKKIVVVWLNHDSGGNCQFQKEMTLEIMSKIHFVYHDRSPLNQQWQHCSVLEASQLKLGLPFIEWKETHLSLSVTY